MKFIATVFAMFALQASASSASEPTVCADAENKDCACNGDVYFGLKFANGKPGDGKLTTFERVKQSDFKKKTVSGSIKCSTDAFGGEDPLPGFFKYCFCEKAPYKSCDEQERFNVMMCQSHMCTKCTLDWAMKACQKTQASFPTCRCEDWPKSRTSYSGGDFAGKGKFGDAGDYAKAASAFLSTEIVDDA